MKVTKNNISFDVIESGWKSFWENDQWESYMWPILSKYILKDQNYLDIGAWIGPTVLYGSQLCKTCYAIEPDPIAVTELRSNVNLNKFQNVHIYECALSNFNGITHMGAANLGDSMFRFTSTDNLTERPCYTISEFVQRNDIKDVSFIKMDIEGGEEKVLTDLDFFARRIPMHLSLHHIFYPDPTNAYNVISTVCKMYKNMYDVNFNKVDVDFINQKNYDGFLTIILE